MRVNAGKKEAGGLHARERDSEKWMGKNGPGVLGKILRERRLERRAIKYFMLESGRVDSPGIVARTLNLIFFSPKYRFGMG